MDKNADYRRIINLKSITVYGAGLMARNVHKVLSDYPFQITIPNFIVESKENNPKEIGGIEVISLDEADKYKDSPVLVALHEKYLPEVLNKLRNRGFTNLIPITFDDDFWCDIREEWITKNNLMSYGAKYLQYDEDTATVQDGNKSLHIYVVHSQYDKELGENIADKPYEISIQVGANLTDKIMFPVRDNMGENISDKNKEYCELTGLYWAWKNDKSDYIGLSHYRRKFTLSDREINAIYAGDVDIVVTVPLLNLDTVKGQYIKDHSESDWYIMTEAINELYPEYTNAVEQVGNGNFYFAYNMFIAKNVVLNDYCEWLFNILNYCEEKIGPKDDVYQNRFAGFLAERLLTVYIAKHAELNVAVAHKHFIETKVL